MFLRRSHVASHGVSFPTTTTYPLTHCPPPPTVARRTSPPPPSPFRVHATCDTSPDRYPAAPRTAGTEGTSPRAPWLPPRADELPPPFSLFRIRRPASALRRLPPPSTHCNPPPLRFKRRHVTSRAHLRRPENDRRPRRRPFHRRPASPTRPRSLCPPSTAPRHHPDAPASSRIPPERRRPPFHRRPASHTRPRPLWSPSTAPRHHPAAPAWAREPPERRPPALSTAVPPRTRAPTASGHPRRHRVITRVHPRRPGNDRRAAACLSAVAPARCRRPHVGCPSPALLMAVASFFLFLD